ncbi:hypothetical protein BV20DRAFT_1057041 [Pilatotrama ljubarskyi]|nr:hypothetical protein BV20DRAFT_1057041 [Pilatotrama ljubarskyi]
MKSKVAREKSQARQPYESRKRPNKRLQATTAAAQLASTSKPLSDASRVPIPPSDHLASTRPRPLRETLLEQIYVNFPGIQPRTDWEIIKLGTSRFEGTPAEIYAWLDESYAYERSYNEDVDACVQRLLGTPVALTGRKPGPDDKLVYTRPIPDSKYSIRLFPGAHDAAEYCMDFVETATGQPVNSPFEYELWSVPNPDTPWLTAVMTMQLRTIESAHRLKPEDIRPGTEKFVLRDGQTCMLIRPGKRPVRFTVPVRPLPQSGLPEEDVDVFDFPKIAVV